MLSAVAWYVTISILIMWCLRDLNRDWAKEPIKILQKATGTGANEFPVLDLLRAADYPIPDLTGNLPTRLACLSFAVIAARYYQALFAGITPLASLRRSWLGVRAVMAEVFMRLGTVVPWVLIFLPTVVERQLWPICTALGISYTFLTNYFCRTFARDAIRQANKHGLSTVPTEKIPGLENFYQWVPTSALYCCVVWLVASLIYVGRLHDVVAYSSAVAIINVLLFYVIKCGLGVSPVRVGLSRACLAAERVRYVTSPSPRRAMGV